MSRYVLTVPDCNGTAAVPAASVTTGIHCMGLYHGLDLPVLQVGSGRRTEGNCVHGHVVMVHKFDEASPALRHKAAGGNTIPAGVAIYRMTQGEEETVVEKIVLADAKIASVVSDVPVREDGADVGDELFEYVSIQYGSINWTHGTISKTGTVSGAALPSL